VLLAEGCGALTSRHADQFIVVHKAGYLIDLKREEVTDSDEYLRPLLDRIDEYVRTRPSGEKAQLLLFVHGGLSTYSGALERVDGYIEAQRSDPHLAKYHLIFINWDSSLPTSVADDLFILRLGEPKPILGPVSSPFITASRLASSGFAAPQSLSLQVSNAYDAYIRREKEPWKECALPPLGAFDDKWVIPNTAAFFAFYVIRALTVPVIQGFGTPAWDTMKRRAELVVAPTKSLSLKKPDARGGGRTLMETLQKRIPRAGKWRDTSGNEYDLGFTLVGHSMGTMILDHVLDNFSSVVFERIVYLAAAASIDEVRSSVFPYLRGHPATQFWVFTLSETREALEWDYLDMFDRGSLLVWIDHYFQRINAPGDRVFGRAKNLREYFEVPDDLRRRVFIAKFNNGAEDPTRHGDFSDPAVLERVLGIVEGGNCP
jgi:hypothetical protein